MNTHDKYELPPLPKPRKGSAFVCGLQEDDETLLAWGRACVEADRKRRGEPIGFLVPTCEGSPPMFIPRDRTVQDADTAYGWQPVFAAPQPAEPVKCEACRDSGIIGHSDICPCCQDTWEPADSSVRNERTTAEPVKVPSEEDGTELLFLAARIEQAAGRAMHINIEDAGRIRTLLSRYGAQPAINGYTCTVPDDCETLHWRGQILSMNELASVAQPAVGELDIGDAIRTAARKLDLAHEIWAAVQTAPGEGIEDAVARIASLLLVGQDREDAFCNHPESLKASNGWGLSTNSMINEKLCTGCSNDPNKNKRELFEERKEN